MHKGVAGTRSYGTASTGTVRTTVSTASGTSFPKATISIKEEGGNVNHAKIISEVLKKYPHLVKNNKNIKLKILQKSSSSEVKSTPPTAKVYPTKIATGFAQQTTKIVQKISPQIKPQAPQTPAQAVPPRPKRIDAKTMHELIAKGAENTTGPWLCLRCGIDGRPISIPSYKSFRKHLVSVHKEKIDARLCEECGYKSADRNDLNQHLFDEHNIQIQKREPHKVEQLVKTESGVKAIQQCAYCNKVFLKETTLNTHIKTYHREQAILDGVIRDEGYIPNNPSVNQSHNEGGKVQVLSNIALPTKIVIDSTTQKLEPSSEAEALSNVASGITTSLTLVGTDIGIEDQYSQHLASGEYITTQQLADTQKDSGARLVTSDGSELQLSAAQKEEILSQLQNSDGGNVIMVLNHEPFDENQTAVVSTAAGLSSASNIMVVYSQANETNVSPVVVTDVLHQQTQPITEVVKSEVSNPIEQYTETESIIESSLEPVATVTTTASTENVNSTIEQQAATELIDTSKDQTEVIEMSNVEEQLQKMTGGETISRPVAVAVKQEDSLHLHDVYGTVNSSSINDSLNKSNVEETVEDAEKAKQSLISTLQGDW